MTLTTRLTSFFLTALGVVLVGFSLTLYLLADRYLGQQASERAEAALDTLAAAVDISEGLLEWEGHERQLNLGKDASLDQPRWTVHVDAGNLVAKSDNLPPGELSEFHWYIARRTMRAVDPSAATRPSQNGEPVRHAELTLTAAVSREPVDATLRTLALTLAGLSALVFAGAALTGRWLCRRALTPVTAMAGAARAMSAADLDARLPAAGTADELADLEHSFNDLLGRLQDAFERQRRFTGDASHQLRTPLAAMLGQLEVALRRERAPAEYREVLGKLTANAQHLRQIVEMLLFLARSDAEAPLPALEVVDLAVWLPTHLEGWADHPRRADMRVEAQTASVRVQPALLGQLLDNLLDNACKYSEPGTPITLRVTHCDGDTVLAVEDAGSGIAVEDLPHLFEPFYRSEQARLQGKAGVGLGLAVAKRIAGALGASVDVESVGGYGSRFIVCLRAQSSN